MTRDELEAMEEKIMDEFAKRRALGGFDANASTILLVLRWIYEITRHERENAPRPKETPDETQLIPPAPPRRKKPS
jgi:hypothetical protein